MLSGPCRIASRPALSLAVMSHAQRRVDRQSQLLSLYLISMSNNILIHDLFVN
jgi:hypothetical protein